MNKSLQNFLRLIFLTVFCINVTVHSNVFVTAAKNRANLITQKAEHKFPLEFKHAVALYVKNSDIHYTQESQRHGDDNVSYKKEMKYLLKNCGNFSTSTLLVRICSAHQEMVKHETNMNGSEYKKYEQVASALLLVCAQYCINDARNQILNALIEIDHLIAYWRYQRCHPITYFFSKSPIKWLCGKSQEREVVSNLSKLERKQRELYIILGTLTEHIHSFTEIDCSYNDCYAWIELLLDILSCISSAAPYDSDGTKFDTLAVQLKVKLKAVGNLKKDLLLPIASAKKPTHLMRNWIAYTTIMAAAGYTMHYHINNPLILPGALAATQVEMIKFLNLLLDPFDKIYKRAQVAFSPEIINEVKSQPYKEEVVGEFDHLSLEEKFNELEAIGKEITSDIAKELAKSNTSLREDAVIAINEGIQETAQAWRPYEGFDLHTTKEDLQLIKDYNDAEAIARVRAVNALLMKQASGYTRDGWILWAKMKHGDGLLRLVHDYLDPLQIYTDIIDKKILKLIRLIAVVAENLIRRGDALATRADRELQDNELTFMFTALIPLITTGFVTAKTYQWITAHDYSPIRIALADVNALLIEAVDKLDEHDYGKLVYLICKLRNRFGLLKDPLAYEFLSDVAKLESKQYSTVTKRGIVENMFNKYAFLGRIAV